MLPKTYAREHFKIALASGVFRYTQNSLADSTVLSSAVRNVPACEYCECVRLSGVSDSSPSMGLYLAGPSKFDEPRRVICLRIRSPVPGRIKVPFLSFWSECQNVQDRWVIWRQLTPRLA
jgi:hypothetical protein